MSLPRPRTWLSALIDRIGILIEVGDQHDEASPPERLRQLLQRREQRRFAGRRLRVARGVLDAVERVQHEPQMLGRRRHVVDDVVVDRRHADAVALQTREVRETRRHVAGVRQLREPIRPPDRRACIASTATRRG